MLDSILEDINRIPSIQLVGKVVSIKGLLLECVGIEKALSVGARCRVEGLMPQDGHLPSAICEVVGFREDRVLLMPFSGLEGIGLGARVIVLSSQSAFYPSDAWLGRVVNAFGDPVDDKGPLVKGTHAYRLRNDPPSAHSRQRVKGKMDLGIGAINTFLTCCRGQRMGIFAGSGVGKSILMSMLARYSQADVNVIGLIGERGREVQEFIEDDLGEEGLKRSVVVVATSSDSALLRRQAAYATLCVAEYFRDQGKNVLCIMDSVTRFAMAQREIGLSAGEPPTTKGYTPTVFSELPHLLERAGPGGPGQGSISAMFSVLVEGDDTSEPIADTVRGILDGHIVLDRAIAERGRFPAINILRSVSRTMPDCNSEKENQLVVAARRTISTYEDMAEMIRLGAYRKGTDPEVDRAIQLYPAIENFLRQRKDERVELAAGYAKLAGIMGDRMAIKSFNTLIKLHKRRVDIMRRELQTLEEQKNQLLTLSETLKREHAQEMEVAASDAKMAGFFGPYSQRVREKQDAIAEEVKKLDKAIFDKTELIRAEFAEQKKFEIARENEMKRLAEKEKQRQQTRFDEIGNQQFIKLKEQPV